MRRVWGGIATAILAVSFAAAEEQAGAPGAAADTKVAKVLFFSGTDFWSTGAFVHGGLMWSPDGLNRDGFTLKMLVSGGTYRYRSGALGLEVTGQEISGAAMAGWRFKFDRVEVTAFVGPDFQDYRLTPDDPKSGARGRYFGVRGAIDVWYEPIPGTMAAFNASGSTADSDYSVRLAVGWRLFERMFVGPEAQAFGCPGYEQLRLGMHVTGLRFGAFEWNAAGGWTDDSDHRAGAYGHLGVLARY